MTYVSGFVAAVPADNKAAYIDSAKAAWTLFSEYGAISTMEAWEDDVPDGEVTSFAMAVKREPGEKIVFSWIVWPDKAASDRCTQSFRDDPRWEAVMTMPFDGKRMIIGGFSPIFEA